MPNIDLNCDCGESWGPYVIGADADMLAIVSSANIACGFHGGDPLVLHRTLTLARQRGVGAGAHPSLIDPWGFGRRRIAIDDLGEIEKIVIYQLAAIRGMAETLGMPIRHVKPHGSLGNMAALDFELSLALCRAAKAVDPRLIFLTSPGNETERAVDASGLQKAIEIYADRAYDERGDLMSRRREGAVLHDPDLAAARILGFLQEGAITTVDGRKIPMQADTICVHGDNPRAVAVASRVREALTLAGWTISPLAQDAKYA